MLIPGKYCGGKVEVTEKHGIGHVLDIEGKKVFVTYSGAVMPYADDTDKAAKVETVIGGTKIPKPPKL